MVAPHALGLALPQDRPLGLRARPGGGQVIYYRDNEKGPSLICQRVAVKVEAQTASMKQCHFRCGNPHGGLKFVHPSLGDVAIGRAPVLVDKLFCIPLIRLCCCHIDLSVHGRHPRRIVFLGCLLGNVSSGNVRFKPSIVKKSTQYPNQAWMFCCWSLKTQFAAWNWFAVPVLVFVVVVGQNFGHNAFFKKCPFYALSIKYHRLVTFDLDLQFYLASLK